MVTEAPQAPASAAPNSPQKGSNGGLRPTASLPVILVKIVALAIVDAILLYAVFVLIASGPGSYLVAALAVVALLLLNWIYLSKKILPWKYLAPGLAFLLIFQVFVILYSAYIGFTNYGDGHNGSKEDAIASIQQNSLARVADSPTFGVTVVRQSGELGLLVTNPDGSVGVGSTTKPLQTVTNATMEAGKATAVPGWETVPLTDLLAQQDALAEVAVPISSDLAQGAIRTADASTGFLFQPTLRYDDSSSTFTNISNGTVYRDDGRGAFAAAGGQQLTPGWTVNVGFTNFTRIVTDASIRGPVIGVVIWTFVFAGLTTFLAFAVGLFFAIAFNHPTMRGKKIYRVIMILPYAFPGFLSALVWAGLLNQQFGFINTVLLGGAQVPWLSDPTLAKLSVLLVNVWLGFPYMFLVSTGALQSIPEEAIEAATVDGARAGAIFRLIKLPLLLVTMAPILIATFAFNFNNFNIVYLLTGGGPTDINAPINVGGSDILISLVYKIAFLGQNGRDYGLASAFSILIFIIIATISVIAFRRTKSLEDIN